MPAGQVFDTAIELRRSGRTVGRQVKGEQSYLGKKLPVNAPSQAVQVDELTALYRLTDRLYRAQSLPDVFGAALDAIIATLGCDRASILLFDGDGVMDFVAWRGLSDGYRKAVRGHSPWTSADRDPRPIFVVDIDETSEPEEIKRAVRREDVRGLAFIPLVANGAIVGKFMTYYQSPRIFADYERDLAVTIARQVGFSLERAWAEQARRKTEEELRESEERFRVMSEHAPVMIWMSDASGRCLHLNRMLREFWGVEDKNVAGFDWRTTMHPEDADRIGREMWDALQRRQSVVVKGRYTGSARQYRVLQTDARPRLSPTGEFLGMLGVNVDITERERAEAQRELLLAELNHRVKNTLAVVQGIAHQTFRGDGALPVARRAFDGRLVALAAAHNLLTRSNWENASVADIAADSLQMGDQKDRVRISGPRVLLAPKEAVALAMALHELKTNAIKYGALSNERGHVELTWAVRKRANPAVHLVWQERDGPPLSPPTHRGFGSLLLERTLALDLNGKVELLYRPEGLRCGINMPLSHPAGAPS